MNGNEQDLSMIRMLNLLLVRWKFVAVLTLLLGIASFTLSFLLHDQYKAQAKIIPAGILSTDTQVSNTGLLDAARSMGVSIGDSWADPSSLIPELLSSDDFARQLMQEMVVGSSQDTLLLMDRLSDEVDADDREYEASERLRDDVLGSTYDIKSGVTTVSVTTDDPVLSANIALRCVQLLDQFNLDIRMNQAGREEAFIAGRLEGVSLELDSAEQALASFRAANRGYVDSPQLQLEEGRLKRAVQAQQELYILLRRQMEMVGIDKVRSVPLLRVIETPRPPRERSSPDRGLLGFGGACLGFFAALLLVLLGPGVRELLASRGRIGSD